jgi:hypothetical protein
MDNTNKIGGFDRDRINIYENYEVEYWTQTFDICPEYLKKAVEAVGTSLQAVKQYLKK